MGIRSALLGAFSAFVFTTTVAAEVAHPAGPWNLSIPAEPLADALNDLAQQSGLQILFSTDLVARLRSGPLKGSLTADEALHRMLANTGLRFEFVNAHTIAILRSGDQISNPPVAPPSSHLDQKHLPDASPETGLSTSGDHPMRHASVLSRLIGLFAVCSSALNQGIACADEASTTHSDAVGLDTIVVTARKRGESLAEVPTSITVFTAAMLQDYDIQSFNDYATQIPNLSFSYGSGTLGISGARAVAIRGITGQNVVGTGGATGFYIDDTPVPSSLDPRVLDIEDIEVLKGPQGTLYGESSLGGNVRLVTKRPDLSRDDAGYMIEAGLTSGAGSPDGGANFVGNLVLVPDTVALRAVFFVNHDGGYLTRSYPSPSSPGVSDPLITVPRTSVGDQGAATSYGGSLTTLWTPTSTVDVQLRLMFQDTEDHGFPAAFAPLPAFTPHYTLDRAFDVQPKASDRWALPSLDVRYHDRGWELVSSTSFFSRQNQDIEDSTYGTQQILSGYYGVSGLPAQPYLWEGDIHNNQFTEELRASFDPVYNLSGTFGAFYSNTRTREFIPATYATGLVAATATNQVVGPWPNDLLWVNNLPVTQKDASVFGELYYKFFKRFNATVGARQYLLKQDADYTADGFLNFGSTPSAPTHNSESGLSPKFALSYQATEKVMVYTSASKGFRAGGAQTYAPFCAEPGLSVSDITQVRSDTLWTYEAGTKLQVQPGVLVSAAAFHIDWQNFHQQVALPCGLNFVINGKTATINGGEFEASGHVTPALQLRIGVGYEKTNVSDPGALGLVGMSPGSRIVGTPEWNAAVGGVYTRLISSGFDGFLAADYSYTGNATSLLNQSGGILVTRPSYSLANARFGLQSGKHEVSVNVRNLTNARPNLGDLGYNGYIQHDSAGGPIPTVATLQPLTVLLQYRRLF